MPDFLKTPLFTLLGISLFVLSGCTGGLSVQQKKDAAYLMGGKGKYLKKWRLVETYDPYNGGVLTKTDKGRERYVVFFQDGDFIQYESGMYNEGQWRVKTSEDKMALLYGIQNNLPLQPQNTDSTYRYKILVHTADSLVIGIQGRHGIFEQRFQDEPIPVQR